MVAVPITGSNTVERRPMGRERLRYDAPRNFIGGALEDASRALGNAAEDFDQIAIARDDAGAKSLDTEAMTRLNAIKLQYKANRGLNADTAYPEAETAIKQTRDELMERATTPRMKTILGKVLDQRSALVLGDLSEHRATQMFEAEDSASEARITALGESAVAAGNPQEREINLGEGLAEIEARGARRGLGKDEVNLQQFKYRSGIDTAIIRNMVDSDDVDAAVAYRADRMFTAADDERIDKMLRDPLETRQADADLTDLLAGVGSETPGQVVPEVAGARQDAVRSAAAQLGVAPAELAGIFHYESAGTMNPAVKGGDGGRYVGISQFGPEEQRKYEVSTKSTFEEQTAALVRFAKDRGFKPGMGWRKLYTTINAGNPNASVKAADSNGTQEDHYKKLETVHFAAGAAFVGGRLTGGEAANGADLARVDELARAKVASGEWSQERAERVRKRAQGQVATRNSIRAQVESDADRKATEIETELGDNFKSVSQLPAAIRADLSPDALRQFTERARRNASGEGRETNYQLLTELSEQYGSNPQAFLARPPSSYMNGLSKGDYEQVLGWRRAAMGGKGKSDPKQVTHSRIEGVASELMGMAGLKLDGVPSDKKQAAYKRRSQFVDSMSQAVKVWQAENGADKVPTDDAIKKMAANLLRTTYNEKRVFEASDAELVAGMSESDRNNIGIALRAAGAQINTANMARAYREAQSRYGSRPVQ